MIEVQPASGENARLFAAMEEEGTRELVIRSGVDAHRRAMADPTLHCLRTVDEGARAGLIIIALTRGVSVELRRIVVSRMGLGIAPFAILPVEAFCRDARGRSRIWLDVLAHNDRGRRVHETPGYSRFGGGWREEKRLPYYQKELPRSNP